MKYSNTSHKIKMIWDKRLDNTNTLAKEIDKIQKNNNISLLNYNTNKYQITFNTEWGDLPKYDSNDDYKSYYHCWYKEQYITLEQFPIKYLSYIEIKFLYRDPTAENQTQYQIIGHPIVNYSYKIEKEINDYLVNCTLRINTALLANFTASEANLSHQLQGKYLITLINPEWFK